MDFNQLKEYFKTAEGTGILSTADADGKVNSALYAHPRFLEEQRLAFIMLERLSYANLKDNPHAAYLFLEKQEGYKGVRLHLTKVAEEHNTPRIEELMRERGTEIYADKDRYLVTFAVEKILPLVGSDE
ncbi:MAG: pyridoxamine 5'-phosphate oxidase family protein [Desulfuromonadaceae bacterium]|jgi:hypothetical protein